MKNDRIVEAIKVDFFDETSSEEINDKLKDDIKSNCNYRKKVKHKVNFLNETSNKEINDINLECNIVDTYDTIKEKKDENYDYNKLYDDILYNLLLEIIRKKYLRRDINKMIFVRNLTKNAKQNLKTLFQIKTGPDSIKGIMYRNLQVQKKCDYKSSIIIDDNDEISCAFITFKSEDHIEKCLSLNNHVVDGRHIFVDVIKDKMLTFNPSNFLYFHNIPNKCDKEIVRNVISQYSDVVNIKNYNKSTGCGYVEFKNSEDALRILELSKKIKIDGQKIHFKRFRIDDNKKKCCKKIEVPESLSPSKIKQLILSEYDVNEQRSRIKVNEKGELTFMTNLIYPMYPEIMETLNKDNININKC